MGLRAGLDAVEKRQFLILPGMKFRPLGRPARSQLLYMYILHIYMHTHTYIHRHSRFKDIAHIFSYTMNRDCATVEGISFVVCYTILVTDYRKITKSF
jgi:hypothetical protein